MSSDHSSEGWAAHDAVSAHRITFADPATRRCPFGAYERLIEEAPVYLDPGTGHYVVTRYEDVSKVLLDHRTFSNAVGLVGLRDSAAAAEVTALYAAEGWPLREAIQSMDPPQHRKKRSIVDKAFAHWNVEKAKPRIEEIANELIDGFIDDGQVEFVSGFAAPLTIAVISEQLGMERVGQQDFKHHVEQVKHWSNLNIEAIDPLLTPQRHIEITRELIKIQHFYAANVDRVMRHPDETLLSKIVQTVRTADGEPDMPEILELMKTIFITGNETTRFALAVSIKLLIEHPEIAQELAARPERISDFVEEALRLFAPTQALWRRATRDVELHGVRIPEGARVEVRYGAANRDSAAFECPAKLQLDRTRKTPHLTFGKGIHSCIGMPLARAELNIGLAAVLRRMMNFRAANGEASYEYSDIYVTYGLMRLDLAFARRA